MVWHEMDEIGVLKQEVDTQLWSTMNLYNKLKKRVREVHWLIISELSLHFLQISRHVLYEVVIEKFFKFRTLWIPEFLTEKNKTH